MKEESRGNPPVVPTSEAITPGSPIPRPTGGPADGRTDLKSVPSDSPAARVEISPAPAHHWRKWMLAAVGLIGLIIVARILVPWVVTALNTVSTDDAYVNGHVTFVEPRVAGQVRKVLVD